MSETFTPRVCAPLQAPLTKAMLLLLQASVLQAASNQLILQFLRAQYARIGTRRL